MSLLAREQRIAAAILCGIALIVWFVMAICPSPIPPNPSSKKPWSERRDSIRLADSLRFEQWKADREARYDSFFIADSIRHEQWRIERQQRWDSMRVADSLWRDSMGICFVPRPKKDTILDLNHCDTTELQLIRGIGRYTAVQIVSYRQQLGGYYSPSQLLELPNHQLPITNYPSFDTLLHRFTADTTAIQRIPVNSSSVDRLARHPYLRYEQAKAIYTLRRNKVRLSSIEDLRSLSELPDSTLLRLAPYLSFE